ncbi:MAG: sigma-54 dependent transcriptional regulator [Nitrospiraceae bacterium]|nr:sigma-54 dependent transcriptional regulator [Nitrospiraceae bacterium]
MPRILLIDDEEGIALAFRMLFEEKGYDFLYAGSAARGLEVAARELPDVILLDLFLPDMNGLDVLMKVKASQADTAVIIITGCGEVREAVKAIKLGADNYFIKPVDIDELEIMIEKNVELVKLRREAVADRKKSLCPIIGGSEIIGKLKETIRLVAENPLTTVLVEGETGTGKEVAARNIHGLSARAGKPFVDINCASVPETVFESELFGYDAGAFTDARHTRKGLLELADGGTLFLDEISEMPLPVQAKFLRVLETRSFRRLGGTRDLKVDIRIVSATNRALFALAEKGLFRKDLFYRLNVMPVKLPPLRQRAEDIPALARFFTGELSAAMGRKPPEMDEGALAALCAYDWPGNVRELKNTIERALILCRTGLITSRDLALGPPSQEDPEQKNMTTLEGVEKAHIRKVLVSADNNHSLAARILGISRSTLGQKIKKYNLK